MPSFCQPNRYGFEMVDADGMRAVTRAASIEYLRRIESFGFFTDLPRFRFNADTGGSSPAVSKGIDCENNPQRNEKTRTGSRDVLPASHGILARAGARAVAKREDAGIGKAAAARRVRGGVGGDRRGVG